VTSTILANGTGGQVSYYSTIIERKKELSLVADAMSSSGMHLSEYNLELSQLQHLIKHLEEEEAALFHAIRFRQKEEVPIKGREEVALSTV